VRRPRALLLWLRLRCSVSDWYRSLESEEDGIAMTTADDTATRYKQIADRLYRLSPEQWEEVLDATREETDEEVEARHADLIQIETVDNRRMVSNLGMVWFVLGALFVPAHHILAWVVLPALCWLAFVTLAWVVADTMPSLPISRWLNAAWRGWPNRGG
jgi:hypothetical protein